MKTMFEIAMEAHLDAVPRIEREVTAYVKLKDLYDITSIADRSETHEQWQLLTDSKKGKMRIRLTDGVEHSLTTKENTRDDMASVETETKIEASFFEVLKRSYAKNGYLKTRYEINKRIRPFVDVAYQYEKGQKLTTFQEATDSEKGWLYGAGIELVF